MVIAVAITMEMILSLVVSILARRLLPKLYQLANVKELLTEKKTKTLRGFKGKSGKKFDACLKLEADDTGKYQVVFDFDNVEANVVKDAKCPFCGGQIVKTYSGFNCENYDYRNPGFHIVNLAWAQSVA